jgi:FtsZ-interacting cell division protein ZipA
MRAVASPDSLLDCLRNLINELRTRDTSDAAMSELQLALVVIGAIVIVAVVAYNKWQEARLARRAERDFGSRHGDVLIGAPAAADAAHKDDELAAQAARDASPAGTARGERVEHTLGDLPVDAPPAPVYQGMDEAGHVALDARLDCIVEVAPAQPVSGSDVLAAAGGLVDEGLVKPLRWEGLDAGGGGWGPLAPDGRYAALRAGLQLADRAGPATEADIGAFFGGMQEVALALAAELELPDPDAAVAQARELDAFCADVDVQIGLNVIATATQPFAGTKLRALAEAGGMQLAADGAFHRVDDRGHELFSLTNGEDVPFRSDTLRTLATPGVTVMLDVPRAPGSASTFRLYLDFAHQLEQALGGMLVDDHKKPVGQAALERIGRQLERIHAAMEARGIPAGSPAAQRLFA